MKSQEEQKLHAQAEQVRGKLQGLAADLRAVDGEVEKLAPQRAHNDLLDQACGSLEKLAALGAAPLFWGEHADPARAAEQLRGVRSRVSAFQAQMGALDERRQAILASIGREQENLEVLGEDLYDIREEEERRKLEWVVERDMSPVPRRIQLMAWARGGEDDRRFRRTLGSSLMASMLFGALLPMIDLPVPTRFVPDEIPKRLVQFVREEKAKPLPPVVAQKPPEQTRPDQQKPKPGQEPKQPEAAPKTPAAQAAQPSGEPAPGIEGLPPGIPAGPESPVFAESLPQKPAGKPGILAFKDQFASLAKDRVAPRLGADARYGNAEDSSRETTRSMLTTNAPGTSGGINLASLSRNVGGRGGRGGGGGALHGDGYGGGGGGGNGGGGGGIQRVEVASPIAPIGGGERPLANGPGASRTDEEIQIVFDRYKASFYRLYNRELRKDPTLQGQMVLRLTIEPDGSVSMCVLQSSDMNAPDLAAQVVSRVRTINFGAKEGVQALTIVYPIDFLPAYENGN